MVICKTFLNRPLGSYIPLACKQQVITVREITQGGDANKREVFFLFKPNTLREHATLDLLYPQPQWLVREIESAFVVAAFLRITAGGNTRITVSGDDRVTAN